MPSDSIELKGLDELVKRLGAIEAGTYRRAILVTGAQMLKSYIAVYPKSTAANSPGGPGSRWYERGYGPKWQRKDGSVNGMQTSEALGRRWAVEVHDTEAIVGNNASYARFVQSDSEQATVHRRNQWRTDVETIREVGPRIEEMARVEIQRAVDKS